MFRVKKKETKKNCIQIMCRDIPHAPLPLPLPPSLPPNPPFSPHP